MIESVGGNYALTAQFKLRELAGERKRLNGGREGGGGNAGLVPRSILDWLLTPLKEGKTERRNEGSRKWATTFLLYFEPMMSLGPRKRKMKEFWARE